ncbi:hypothetical protein BH11MYX1_BH11MYX1_16650 [soil metagenome]
MILMLTAAGCVYDANSRCGPAMTFDETLSACVCANNAVVDGLGCKPCAADEVAQNGACGCAPGAAKSSAGVCEHVAGLGDACAGADDCTSDAYPYCAPATAGVNAATCTSTCETDLDCAPAYTCATWEPHPYCRTFAGLGTTCASSADCAATDAQFCDVYQSHTCIVSGCSLATSDCPRGSMCCDFSQYGLGTLCAPACQ